MTTYTTIPKPTGTPYTNLNTQGKQQYDQPDLLFDSANVFYDSVNNTAYTSVIKPSLTPHYTWAQATFSFASATFAWNSGGVVGGYTNVSKPV